MSGPPAISRSRHAPAWGVLCLAWLVVSVIGCASKGQGTLAPGEGRASERAYEPDRREYLAFREGWPDLIEPNYLPFMVHRFEGDAARGDVLVF